jgi:hypothetical protein
MKIKFTEDINLAVNDYNWGDEYKIKIKKDDEKEVVSVEDNTHGYKDIHFLSKVVAESVHSSAFVVL